jgi:hypothetical protein
MWRFAPVPDCRGRCSSSQRGTGRCPPRHRPCAYQRTVILIPSPGGKNPCSFPISWTFPCSMSPEHKRVLPAGTHVMDNPLFSPLTWRHTSSRSPGHGQLCLFPSHLKAYFHPEPRSSTTLFFPSHLEAYFLTEPRSWTTIFFSLNT